jgi:hypothetical protein
MVPAAITIGSFLLAFVVVLKESRDFSIPVLSPLAILAAIVASVVAWTNYFGVMLFR